jgi:hypothetical protein
VTPEEAKARVAAQDEKLRGLEAAVAHLATSQPSPVLLAMMRAIVEMLCAGQGPNFRVLNKIKFYEAVLMMLHDKGIS